MAKQLLVMEFDTAQPRSQRWPLPTPQPNDFQCTYNCTSYNGTLGSGTSSHGTSSHGTSSHGTSWSRALFCFWFLLVSATAIAQDQPTDIHAQFEKSVRPFLTHYCTECHNVDQRESGIRVDNLSEAYDDSSLKLWEAIGKLVLNEEMPPEEAEQPTAEERLQFLDSVNHALNWARGRELKRNGNIRRLTVSQYANTLRDLLSIDEQLTGILPPDGISKDGFSNNSQTLQLNPTQLEAYLQIAEKALDLVLIDETAQPTIQAFQMSFGQNVNPAPYPSPLVLGALNHLLPNQDFLITEESPQKNFPYTPFLMQRKFRFIEGYQGNDTVREWRDFDSIYHSVFACMRGSEGYPKGKAYESVRDGLLLRPAIPSSEIFGEASTYGPFANFKIALRELPEFGNFRVKVWASKYNDALLLDTTDSAIEKESRQRIDIALSEQMPKQSIEISEAGIYQIDLSSPPMLATDTATEKNETPPTPLDVELVIGERKFSKTHKHAPFMLIRLNSGPVEVGLVNKLTAGSYRLSLLKLPKEDPKFVRFENFEKRSPAIGVYAGLRRDCGSTLNPVGEPQTVSGAGSKEYLFTGAINNYPRPDVEVDNVNYLAGFREIAVRCEYTDGRDMPRLLIHKIEFEGPYFEQWPPQNYTDLMGQSKDFSQIRDRAERVVRNFAQRAFRRPVRESEVASLMQMWDESDPAASFTTRIRPLLLVILTSPQFLFLTEISNSAESEPLDDWELASKLSYFLWNSPPNHWLSELASQGKVRSNLREVLHTMIQDERYRMGADAFVSQWLSLDKLEVVNTDSKRFPHLNRSVKIELRKEPIEFWLNKLRGNKPLAELYRSEEIVVNDILASYYGLGEQVEAGLQFVAVKHQRENLGGILTHAAILAGLSDGREPNPVKRGAWLARKIIAEPPGDPPPNVPALEDLTQFTLRQRLEKHRDVAGCAKCHQGIDPWGLPFEEFDAGGLHRSEKVDSSTVLADGTKLAGFSSFREYLLVEKQDQLAFSLAKHLSIFASGKPLSYKDEIDLRRNLVKLKSDGYRLQDLLECVVASDAFLMK